MVLTVGSFLLRAAPGSFHLCNAWASVWERWRTPTNGGTKIANPPTIKRAPPPASITPNRRGGAEPGKLFRGFFIHRSLLPPATILTEVAGRPLAVTATAQLVTHPCPDHDESISGVGDTIAAWASSQPSTMTTAGAQSALP